MSSTMELVPLLCLFVLICSGSTSAAGAEPKRISVKKGTDAILPCSTTTTVDITREQFEWKKDKKKEVYFYAASPQFGSQDKQFVGRVSHFPGELEKGNASITIKNTERTDTGEYICEFRNVELNVKPEVPIYLLVGTASISSASATEVTPNSALLWCEVHGELIEPVVQWKNSKGESISNKVPDVSEDRGKYTVVLKTTVTKSGNYSCVATQKEISHEVASYTSVSLDPETPAGFSTGVVVGAVGGGVVLGICVLIAVQHCIRKMKSQSNSG